MLRSAIFLAGLLTAMATAHAEPPPPPGWEPVEMVYLLGTAHYDRRLADTDGFLAAHGDFDGDGGEDTARLFVDRQAGRAALLVTMARDPRPWARQLASVPLPDVVALGIAAGRLGDYLTNCNAGVSDDRACGDVSQVGDHDTLKLITFGQAARLFWWSNGDFVSAWMSE